MTKTAMESPKKPGRIVRDPERSRETILTCAMDEFVAKGYDGARVDAIAAKCGLSKNLLYHYYDSKQGLFAAVIQRMYETLRLRSNYFTVDTTDPERGLEQLIARTFTVFWEYPEFISLLNTANLHKATHIGGSVRVRNRYTGLIATIAELLQKGAETGVFRAGIDPVFFYIALASLSYHYLSNQYTFKVAIGVDLASKKKRESWLAFSTAMMLAYCRASEAGAAVLAPALVGAGR